jgi:hypothetical protein
MRSPSVGCASLRTVPPPRHCRVPSLRSPEPKRSPGVHSPENPKERPPMKGIIAWLLGVPIVVIILLYVFNIF